MGGGEWPANKQFVEYHISSDAMVDHGQNELLQDIYGIAMYFSQYDNTLFMKGGRYDQTIVVHDLSSSLFPYDASTIQKGTSNILGESACVTASEHFLFVLGGWEGGMLSILNVLSLPGHVWSLGPE
eukprot:183598_1